MYNILVARLVCGLGCETFRISSVATTFSTVTLPSTLLVNDTPLNFLIEDMARITSIKLDYWIHQGIKYLKEHKEACVLDHHFEIFNGVLNSKRSGRQCF